MLGSAVKKTQDLAKIVDSFRQQHLPKSVLPNQYILCIKPSLDDNTFEGSVCINVTLLTNTKQIALHSVDVIITKIMWEEDITENRQEPAEIQTDKEKGLVKLLFDPFLVPCKGMLRINFKGRISDKKLSGLYRTKPLSTPSSESEESYSNLVARFEPVDARKVFPCWDEPDVKATFDIFLIVPRDNVVLSNMEEKVNYPHKKNPNLKIVEFKRTPMMAPCFTGFVCGRFEHIEGKTKDDTLCRVFTPPGRKEDGNFALELMMKLLPYYKMYFDYPFPLNKLDVVSITDLSTATQNNWGLLYIRQVYLLINENVAGAAERQTVSLMIAQGITQQWFGNLVSNFAWSEIYLKEGFATFAKYIGIDNIFPEYDIWNQFVADVHLGSMKLDSLKSTNPVFIDLFQPQDMDTTFDDLDFKKAAALLRMLHRYIGDADFRKGLKKYFHKHHYSSANADSFWHLLEEASSKPIHTIMNNWTHQRGFPVIKVTARQDGKSRVLKLTQDRFTYDAANREHKGIQKDLWTIPLTIATGNKPNKVVKELLMESKTLNITIPDVAANQWIKLNPGTIGYYRVRYPQDMLAQFIPAIRSKAMLPLDRLGLLDDVFALVTAGFGPTVEVLSLTEAYCEEEEYVVWVSMCQMFDKLLKVFGHLEYAASLKAFGLYIFHYIYVKLGWEAKPNETHVTKILRTLILRQMTKFGHEGSIQRAMEIWELKKKGQEIPADLRYTVYNAVLTKADDDIIKQMLKMYRDSDNAEERDRIAASVGSVSQSKHARLILDFIMTEDIRKQDAVKMLVSLSKNKAGRDVSWSYFKDNWQNMKTRFSPSLLATTIKGITEGFYTEEKASEVADYSKDHMVAGCERAYAQAVEWIRINDAWIKRENSSTMMKDFLESF